MLCIETERLWIILIVEFSCKIGLILLEKLYKSRRIVLYNGNKPDNKTYKILKVNFTAKLQIV